MAKFIDMGNWLVDEVDKKTKILFQCSIRNKIRYHRNIYLPVLESVLQEYVKAFCAPPMYTLALLRMGDSYRRHAVFTSCSQDILHIELIYDEMVLISHWFIISVGFLFF